MPEPPHMVPLYVARVADLRVGRFVAVTCRRCGHVAELSVVQLREKLSPNGFIKHLGPQFRCRQCGHKGAQVDARSALGFYG
jgi:ribosomal protein L37E